DGELGHVEDFIFDSKTWTIRYLVVDTKSLLPGKKVLISPKWIVKVSWEESKVFLDISSEAVSLSPTYSEQTLLDRDYEEGLQRHFERVD
ncbi:MAG: PRC-barrel domain-containing protein, partial [Spirochaetaceae bacterium]|nr:PRC-barrel domain-containing protein [Spirochaetaceae bacterium]